MKNIYIHTALILCIAALEVSCKKDFLNVAPKGLVIATKTSDYNELLNDPNVQTLMGYSTYLTNPIIMGDEVMALNPYYATAAVRTQRLFSWSAVIYDSGQSSEELGLLKTVYTYNKVANEVLNSTGGTEQQKKMYQGEALATRAFYNFMLIQFFAKPYNAATATTDPGFPIVKEADVTASNFTRASVQDYYDFIISDLVAAIPNLPVDQGTRIRMNKSGAEMLLGKVYTFMGKYAAAVPYLNAAFNDLPGSASAYPVNLYDMNQTLATGGTWGYNPGFTPYYFLTGTPVYNNNSEDIFSKIVISYWAYYLSELVITPQTAALYGVNDMRLRLITSYPFGSPSQLSVTGSKRKNSFIFSPVGLTLPELYLLRAECEARTGDIMNALADLYNLRIKRMPAADAAVTITDQTALVKFIIDERSREFALRGFRWFDMRRLSVDPIFSNNIYTHSVYSGTGNNIQTTYTLTPERFLLRFPQNIIDQNPGLVNNP